MTFKRDTSAGFLINHLARLFAKSLNEGIEPLGSSTGQFPILLLLWEEDGLSPSEISHRLSIEKATTTNTLNRMERDGLILREKNPEDARASIIRITDQGLSIREDLTAIAVNVNKQAMKSIDPEDFQTFLTVAQKMIANLNQS